MKFLLVAINAKYIHSNPAIYSLRSYAGEEMRRHIELAEYTINNRMEQILADIYKRKPDVIGFSCYIWNWTLIRRLVREVAKILPEVPIWLGGPEVSYEYEQILTDYPEVTGIMIGEGEETFRELVRAYVKAIQENIQVCTKEGVVKESARIFAADQILQIPGTVTRKGACIRQKLPDMDSLPFYYKELDKVEEKQNENRIVYYESGRGCPFRCSYCLSSVEKQVRLRSTGLVKKELAYFLDKKVKQVKFIDRTFNCNPEHASEIWRFLLENDNGVTNFHFEIAADLLNKEELEIFAQMRPGLIQLEIGVQTTNEQTLKEIHRFCDLDKLKRAVRLVHGFGNIHQHLDLIAGLPYEDLESFKNSFDEVYAMEPDQLQLGFLKVLKGSEMFRRAEEYNIVYQSEPPYEVLYTKWISYGEIQELKRVEEMVELFYNSRQFTHTLPVLEKFFGSAYDMFFSLGRFYEEQGFLANTPARSYRYEVLLQFIENLLARKRKIFGQKEKELTELFRELLTFDIYLRENAKSRPGFAGEISSYKQEMTAFYQKQEKMPDILKEYVRKGYNSRQMAHMTHMDVFSYPIWDRKWLEKMEPEKVRPYGKRFVLFDYLKRNPLTYEAAYTVVYEMS